MAENGISIILKEVEKRVVQNRVNSGGSLRTLKDHRRSFDQDSSKMNQAIFNDAPIEEVYQGTLRAVADLVEILLATQKK
jgi:hypothetical protein